MAQDRSLDSDQAGAGLEAQLLTEDHPHLVVGAQGLGLAVRPVEGDHALGPQALPQGMGPGEGVELRDQLTVSAAGEVGLDALFDGGEPGFLEPGGLDSREGCVTQVGQDRAAPERERLLQRGSRPRVIAGGHQASTFGDQGFEAGGIEVCGGDAGDIAGGLSDQHRVAAALAE